MGASVVADGTRRRRYICSARRISPVIRSKSNRFGLGLNARHRGRGGFATHGLGVVALAYALGEAMRLVVSCIVAIRRQDGQGMHHTRREAYDHFLPKDIYPFNSVNFRNLAPMCHECNSTYKLTRDPTRHIDPTSRKTGGTRRRAFHSYATVASGITFTVNLKTKDVKTLNKNDIDIQFTAPGRKEEVEAWKDVFGVEERYKAKFCGKNDGNAWLEHIVEEAENGDLTTDQLLAQGFRAADRSPYDSAYFLKKPFLAACKNAKII
jgi:hypothetical protein